MSRKHERVISLAADERIIAITPERAAGPGWSNALLWVHIVNSEKRYRSEAIQPEEISYEGHLFFDIAALAHKAMLSAVQTKKSRVLGEQK